MAYRRGDLNLTVACPTREAARGKEETEFSGCSCETYHELIFDTRTAWNAPPLPGGIAYLPHSCDEWVIGGADEVRALIADLTCALALMEGRKSE